MALPVELVEYIAQFGDLGALGALRQVCREWADASLEVFARARPEAAFAALPRAPASFWGSEEAARVAKILADVILPREQIIDQFVQAAKTGAEARLVWLHKTFEIALAGARAHDGAFLQACQHGHVAAGAYLAEAYLTGHLRTSPEELRALVGDALGRAAEKSHTAVGEFLVKKFNIAFADICDEENSDYFCTAASRGDIAVLKFFVDCLNPRFANNRKQILNAVVSAAANGRIEALDYLISRFELCADDIRARENLALRLAAVHGVAVLKYLVDRFNLGPADIGAKRNEAFCTAAAFGNTAVLEFLIARFDMSAEDVRRYDNRAFRGAAQYSQIEVLEMLTTRFGLTAVDASAHNNEALRHAVRYRLRPVLEFLAKTFGILP